ncbi:MAG: hypothetical protein SWK76_06355 [Actinomycetota bacterium]|nr:hypothetical protein [Actinomycetota bacterium]
MTNARESRLNGADGAGATPLSWHRLMPDQYQRPSTALKGWRVHRIKARQCCYKPEGASHMMESRETGTTVHVCTGCYGQALANLPEGDGREVLMLPELVERALA